MADVTVQYNPKTGRQRVQLQNGEPIPDETRTHEIISLLCEDPGWPMEETPRAGNIGRVYQEATSGTPSRFKADVEERMQPLVAEGALTSAECETPTFEDGALSFTLRTERPGADPEPLNLEIGLP